MSNNSELIDSDLVEKPEEKIATAPPVARNHILNDSSIFFKGLFGMILCLAPAAIIGLVLVKISLDQAKMAMSEYKENPNQFREESIKLVKRGRVMAYIGLGFFIIEIVALMIYMSVI